MSLSIQEIVKTFALVGADAPAYIALLEQVKSLLSGPAQDTLKVQYEAAMRRSDEAHRRAQET